MKKEVRQPLVVGIPLDDTTRDVVEAAVAVARKLETTIVPVHAIRPYLFPTARHDAADAEGVRAAIREAFQPAIREGGVDIAEPIVEESSPTALLLAQADRLHGQILVVGGGRGPTAGGWLLGTVADRVVRAARCPVLVARGVVPGPGRPILCPIDLRPHSHLALEAALRMARRFEAPLHVLTVLPRAKGSTSLAALAEEASRLERAAQEELAELLRAHDVRDVEMDVRVVAGDAADEIIDAAQRAFMVVLSSRAFDLLVPASVGDVASRVLRNVRCSVLAVRDLDPDVEGRMKQIQHVVMLRDEARAALEAGEIERAERALRIAQTLLPGQATIEDDLATVCDRAGRPDEARRHRDVARILREFHA